MLSRKIFGFLIWVVYRVWMATWRVEIIEHPELQKDRKNKTPFVFAFWHGDELAMLALSRNYRVVTMVSGSRDGEMMATATHLLGMKSTRGSSTRGGIKGLLGLVKIAETGIIPILAVDGPKGPYHKVKPGVLLLSKRLGGKIYPAGVAIAKKKVFEKSWTKAELPLPFTRIVVVWGEPLPVVDDESRLDLAERLEQLLDAARHQAAKVIANT
ncbi:MAG: lysophospholipid acyltransferase family protein [Bdellovibrionia bacterium]